MSIHNVRPSEPAHVLTPPVGTCRGASKGRLARQLLTQLAGLLVRHVSQRDLCMVLLLLGGVVQLGALLYLAYLIDLCISLMEVWALLARKHLEITL